MEQAFQELLSRNYQKSLQIEELKLVIQQLNKEIDDLKYEIQWLKHEKYGAKDDVH